MSALEDLLTVKDLLKPVRLFQETATLDDSVFPWPLSSPDLAPAGLWLRGYFKFFLH